MRIINTRNNSSIDYRTESGDTKVEAKSKSEFFALEPNANDAGLGN